MMNPAMLFKMQGMWDRFVKDHPKFPLFLGALKNTGVEEGTVIEISIMPPNGTEPLRTNLKVTKDDLEMFNELRTMM